MEGGGASATTASGAPRNATNLEAQDSASKDEALTDERALSQQQIDEKFGKAWEALAAEGKPFGIVDVANAARLSHVQALEAQRRRDRRSP